MPAFPSVSPFRAKKAIQRDIEALIREMRSRAANGLHLGCGGDLVPGLINCDWFNPAADRKVNVTDLSPFEDGTVDYIECHHTIEHLSFDEADIAFREWARVLKPGGYAVITCPDFQGLIRRWRTSSRTENWSHTIQMFYGSQEHAGMFHRSGYDRAELSSRLAKCGLAAQFAYTPYPRRPTPSLLVIAAKL